MRIACLDDDDEYAALMSAMLTRIGHEVSLFREPAALMTALEMDPSAVDAVITDYHMPNGNGDSVVARILKKYPGIACAVVSTDDAVTRKSIPGAIICEKPHDILGFKALIARIRPRA